MKYFKDRTENFDDYYSYIEITKREIVNSNVYYLIRLFIYIYIEQKTQGQSLFKFGAQIVLT